MFGPDGDFVVATAAMYAGRKGVDGLHFMLDVGDCVGEFVEDVEVDHLVRGYVGVGCFGVGVGGVC